MKTLLFNLIFLLILFSKGFAQAEVGGGLFFNKAGRQVWITGTDGQKTSRGLLLKVSQDSVYFTETRLKSITAQTTGLEIKRLHYSQIESLVTIRNRPVGKGAAVGSLIGFVSGMLIHAATFESEADPVSQIYAESGGDSALFIGSGFFGATAGVAVGAGVGALSKKKWIIKGLESNFKEALPDLDKRAYWNRSN
ncbi:hypothetical protein [Algoriphagus sp. A40]|uniref:hypothetical protein n=1 Tax=Algoriphagus sp. A40 TaxID=1945863 RepID=UPI001115AA1C|nr:hypothetical protein [Algoriphagus sp. A40]